jgi:hypothetical protein
MVKSDRRQRSLVATDEVVRMLLITPGAQMEAHEVLDTGVSIDSLAGLGMRLREAHVLAGSNSEQCRAYANYCITPSLGGFKLVPQE